MLIIAADMHIGGYDGSEEAFLAFLAAVSSSSHDICFAGDVMELWIGDTAFESGLQRLFLEWCGRESSRRSIYFVEGNREFLVCRSHGVCFRAASPEELLIGRILLVHGDGIPGQNLPHRIFRFFTKCWLGTILLRFLPGRRTIVARIKRGFENKAVGRVDFLPEEAIRKWRMASHERFPDVRLLMFGHFHLPYLEPAADGLPAVCGLPAWKDGDGIVALANPATGDFELKPWKDALMQEK